MEEKFKKMTQKTIKFFINEIYSKPSKKTYPTNKTDVYHFDDNWSLDILDLKEYGPENERIQLCFSYHRHFLKIWLDSSFEKQKSSNHNTPFRNNFDEFKKKTKFIRN